MLGTFYNIVAHRQVSRLDKSLQDFLKRHAAAKKLYPTR